MATLNTRITHKHDTTENWKNAKGFIPLKGEIIIYDDYYNLTIDDKIIFIPGVKVGDGNAYVQDLPFITAYTQFQLTEHINDDIRHITQEEREFWNNKVSADKVEADEVLILTTQ